MTFRHLSFILLLIISTFLLPSTYAAEFRAFNPISTPQKLPPGVIPVMEPLPVDTREVDRAITDLIASWNTPEMENQIGDIFYEKTRLVDTMKTDVPRDAKLRLLSIQSIQTLNQYIEPAQPEGTPTRVSTVSVIAKTQIEYNDPARGFQRREGTNEYVLRIKERFEGGK